MWFDGTITSIRKLKTCLQQRSQEDIKPAQLYGVSEMFVNLNIPSFDEFKHSNYDVNLYIVLEVEFKTLVTR